MSTATTEGIIGDISATTSPESMDGSGIQNLSHAYAKLDKDSFPSVSGADSTINFNINSNDSDPMSVKNGPRLSKTTKDEHTGHDSHIFECKKMNPNIKEDNTHQNAKESKYSGNNSNESLDSFQKTRIDSTSFTQTKCSSAQSPKMNASTKASQEPNDAVLVQDLLLKDSSDYYGILGLSRSATDDQIKKAYRKQALSFHPDKNTCPGSAEAFKMVGRAFSVLGNSEKRKHYDQFGADVTSSNSYSSTSSSSRMDLDPEEIFRSFFREFATSPFNEADNLFFTTNPFHFPSMNCNRRTFHSSSFPFSSHAQWRFGKSQDGPSGSRFAFGRNNPTSHQEPLTGRQLIAQLIPLFVILLLSFLNSFSIQILLEFMPILMIVFLTFLSSFFLR